ncbi:MAG TPA: acylphosphatase [Methanotrichaceae archaeon]|nr:acylphosphatase [Methanotrichaceae archaeon]
MKLRIVIKGPKVHNVGYRYFLMTLARRARIRYFDAENIDGAVEVLVESDEEKITAFKKLVETSRPDRAEVSAIIYEEYDDEIWPISEYSPFCTNVQLNKAIPILLKVVERIDKTNDKQDETMEILSDMDEKMGRMLVRQDETTEAVKDLKLNDSRLVRIENDIKIIKTEIGAR